MNLKLFVALKLTWRNLRTAIVWPSPFVAANFSFVHPGQDAGVSISKRQSVCGSRQFNYDLNPRGRLVCNSDLSRDRLRLGQHLTREQTKAKVQHQPEGIEQEATIDARFWACKRVGNFFDRSGGHPYTSVENSNIFQKSDQTKRFAGK